MLSRPAHRIRSHCLNDALDQPYYPNQFWIVARTASGFSRRLDAARVGGDVLVSDPIDDDQSARIEIGRSMSGIIFDWGASSEANYDKLVLFVNGVERTSMSGEQIQRNVNIPLSTGPALWKIEFHYQKDYSLSRGRDEAWIDNVRFYN